MKWALQQLYKLTHQPFAFNLEYDFSDYIENIDDIYEIKTTKVDGICYRIDYERYEFHLKIKSMMIIQDARTLDPLEFPVNLEVIEVFDTVDNELEDMRLIEKNTIDLKDIIWENVYLQKPIRLVKEELELLD